VNFKILTLTKIWQSKLKSG